MDTKSLKEKELKEFSKGMKMKMEFAAALSHDPKLLILDEATSGLDPVFRDEILDILREYTEDEEHTILMSSHITSDLDKIAEVLQTGLLKLLVAVGTIIGSLIVMFYYSVLLTGIFLFFILISLLITRAVAKRI